MATTALALFAASSSALLLRPAFVHQPSTRRNNAITMQFDPDATRDASPGFDDEGGMVRGIAEGGMSLDEVRAAYGQSGPALPPEKQAQCVLPEESFKVSKLEMSQTDEDFVIECACMDDAEMYIDIEPMFNQYVDYFYGLTADSDPRITIDHDQSSDFEGRMERKGGASTAIKLNFTPNGASGEFDAYLCFMLPEENGMDKFYKITGKSK